jgi:hypothetical protein
MTLVYGGESKDKDWHESISMGGLIVFGGLFENVDYWKGDSSDRSDLTLTSVELAFGVEIHDWVHAEAILLYEDPSFDDETSIDLDVGSITIGNTEKYHFHLTFGKIYAPFGALLTRFPSDPLAPLPLTLLFGEISEKALLLVFESSGFSLSSYLFNGDVDEVGESDHINSFGFDANYTLPDGNPIGLMLGASYIANLADTDGIADGLGLSKIIDSIGGFASYLQLSYKWLFLDLEHMMALEKFQAAELATYHGAGAKPSVWNMEFGMNFNWWRNLEIAFKYAGSREAEGLGLPEDRYGVAFNQEIFDGVIGSFAYFMDEFNSRDIEGRKIVDSIALQIAVEF